MHPYLRLASVVTGSLRRSRLNPLDPARLPMRVMPGDIEITRMNNGRYLTLMDLGRMDFTCRCGLMGAVVKNRWFPLVSSSIVRYRRSLRLGERYDLVSRIAAFDEKYWFMEHRFEAGGELATLAYVKGLFRGSDNVPISTLFAAAGHANVVSPAMPEAIRLWQESEEAMRRAVR